MGAFLETLLGNMYGWGGFFFFIAAIFRSIFGDGI